MTTSDAKPVPEYASLLRLDGRNFIVVGAGQGMGRQSSHALSQSGARVLCVDIDEQRAKEVAAEVGGVPFFGDVTKESEVKRMVQAASDAFGGQIHGFVDIVGIAEWFMTVDMDEEVWNRQFDICLRHGFLLSKHVGAHMIAAGTKGTMVFIASVHGLTASINHVAYGCAKAGVISLVKTLACELGPNGIRANAIAPGSILTPRMEVMLTEDRLTDAAKRIPLGRVGSPPDIASAALFLTSDLSSYITGQTLVVDGGIVITDPFS